MSEQACESWEPAYLNRIIKSNGQGVAQWVNTPESIHVAEGMLLFDQGVNEALMAEGYEVQEPCPVMAEVRHARRATA